jgi:hypothetical protein
MNKTFILAIALLFLASCSDFKDEKLLASHKLQRGGGIGIYYVGVGATAKDNIQVRKGGSNTLFWFTERYDTLLSSRLLNDSTLELVLSTKGVYNKPTKSDTMRIDIK